MMKLPVSSKNQFDAHADKYAVSDVHRAGPSLAALLEMAEPRREDEVLDVATGAGHTALTLAPLVASVIGLDFAPKMLEQARALAKEKAINNCRFVEGSAETLSFEHSQFTLVTSRHAPHHFHRLDKFLSETRRILKSNGRLVIADQISPQPEVSAWLDCWERRRDPSHFLQRTVSQWKQETARAGFHWIRHQIVPYRLEFGWWVHQAGCDPSIVAALLNDAREASPLVREALKLEYDQHDRIIAFHEPILVVRLEPGSILH